jgi:hypothetical protein
LTAAGTEHGGGRQTKRASPSPGMTGPVAQTRGGVSQRTTWWRASRRQLLSAVCLSVALCAMMIGICMPPPKSFADLVQGSQVQHRASDPDETSRGSDHDVCVMLRPPLHDSPAALHDGDMRRLHTGRCRAQFRLLPLPSPPSPAELHRSCQLRHQAPQEGVCARTS